MLLQAFILLAFYLAFRAGMKAIQDQIKEIRTSVLPVVKETGELLTRVGPKIDSLAGDFVAITRDLRVQGSLLKLSANEIVEKVNLQAGRVDLMLTNALNVVDRTGAVLVDAIRAPLKQISAIAAFAKATVSSLRGRAPRPQAQPRPTRSAADRGQFV